MYAIAIDSSTSCCRLVKTSRLRYCRYWRLRPRRLALRRRYVRHRRHRHRVAVAVWLKIACAPSTSTARRRFIILIHVCATRCHRRLVYAVPVAVTVVVVFVLSSLVVILYRSPNTSSDVVRPSRDKSGDVHFVLNCYQNIDLYKVYLVNIVLDLRTPPSCYL